MEFIKIYIYGCNLLSVLDSYINLYYFLEMENICIFYNMTNKIYKYYKILDISLYILVNYLYYIYLSIFLVFFIEKIWIIK